MSWWKYDYTIDELQEKVRVAETILNLAEKRLDDLNHEVHTKTIQQAEKAVENAQQKLNKWNNLLQEAWRK